MKILFLEQHSMKIRQGAFYELEGKRQKYLGAKEAWPYLGGATAFFMFIGCAIVLPLHRRLTTELFGCVAAGMLLTYTYPMYYWGHYMEDVNKIYVALRRQ